MASTVIERNNEAEAAVIDFDKEQIPIKLRKVMRKVIREDNLEAVNSISAPVKPRVSFYTKYGKRAIDIIVALIALIITLPINLVLGICTFFDVGRPIFFLSDRVGMNLKQYKLVKFRNMNNNRDANGELLPPAQRVTKFGKFVRKSSLDELFNFWSILRGDMSVIGPRPLPASYVYSISDRHKMRYSVRPGLECPIMHVDGALTWAKQFENDVWYVENVSLKVDIQMILALVKMVFNTKSNTMRSNAVRGSFEGYYKDGTSINSQKTPVEYYDTAKAILESERAEEYLNYSYID